MPVCRDATRSEYGSPKQPSNLAKLLQHLAPHGPTQMSFYAPGVSAYCSISSGIARRVEAVVESISGSGVNDKVAEAYRRLKEPFEPDDGVSHPGYGR